jgi:hypothetical protein
MISHHVEAGEVRCEFCFVQTPVCVFEATDAILAMEVDEETITPTATGPACWAACESCASKIQAGKWDEIVNLFLKDFKPVTRRCVT